MTYNQEAYGEKYWKGREKLETKHFLICAELWKAFRPKTVLDYGCGMGQFVRVFEMMGIDAFGSEPSEFALQYKFHPKISGVHLIRDYDLILCMDVLEHVPIEEIDSFLKHMKNASTLNQFDIVFSICFKGTDDFEKDPTHITCRTREWWEYKLRKAGFLIFEPPKDWLWHPQTIVAQVIKNAKD